jgi:hypothetical protein
LAAVESGVGTLISFSTQPGNVALDGIGRNSPFAGALVRHISGSTDSLSDLLIAVRNDVRKETQNKQVPWEHSALTGRFFFNAPPQGQFNAPPQGQHALTEAERAWEIAKDTTSLAVLGAFITRYKDSFYVEVARARMEELKKKQSVAAAPPVTRPGVAPSVGQPDERRYIIQLVFPDTSAAERAYAALVNSRGFKEDVEKLGYRMADVELGLVTRKDLIEPKVAEIAFSLKSGELSRPIQGRFGILLLWVGDIQ